MVYTLAQGAQGYNSRLHYSLYGGVEYAPDRAIDFKEFLPLAAVPAVAIALLVALINFHIPVLSPAGAGTGAGGDSAVSHANQSTILLSAGHTNIPAASTGSTGGSSNSVSGSTFTASAPISTLPSLGNDNGQGIIGGMGSGGGLTSPAPTPDPTPIIPTAPSPTSGVTIQADTPIVQTDASVTTQQPQAGVDITVPLTGTNTSVVLGL